MGTELSTDTDVQDILKQKMQASKSANPASMLKLMKRVWKSDGLQGFLRGCDPTLPAPPAAR